MLLLFACSPWEDVTAREEVWYDARAVEAATGLDLVELRGGHPLPYLPRVVVHQDRIDVDNRAWFLTLPGETFELEDPGLFLVERGAVVPVRGGEVPEAHSKGMFLEPLYDALQEVRDAATTHGEQVGGESFDGGVALVFDGRTPWPLAAQVLYTAGQAGFGDLSLAGEAEGRVRGASLGGGFACAMQVHVFLTPDGAWADPAGVAGRFPAEGGCAAPGDLASELAGVAGLCAERWTSEIEQARAHRDEQELLPSRWDPAGKEPCVGYTLAPSRDVDLDEVLTLASTLDAQDALKTFGYGLSTGDDDLDCDGNAPSPDVELDALCAFDDGRAEVLPGVSIGGSGEGRTGIGGLGGLGGP